MNTRLVALVAIGALALTGLGGGAFVIADLVRGDADGYCGALSEERELFAPDESGATLIGNIDDLRALARKAPGDLGDEWQTALAALSGLAEALDEADVSPEDFSGGQAPSSLSEEERQRIAAAASQLTEPDVVEAFGGIDQQARDVCKIQLGL